MKTLKAMVMGLALLLVCGVSQASSGKSTKDEVMDAYLNAVVHGKIAGVENAIDDDAQFNIKRGNSVNSLTKPQMMESLRTSEDLEQQCECTKTKLMDDTDMSVLRVEMKFSDFTRIDVITAQRAGSGWKITKVETSFA